MVAKFKRWIYLCSTSRNYVYSSSKNKRYSSNFKKDLLIQECYIDSKKLYSFNKLLFKKARPHYSFKKITFIQQIFVFSRNLHSLNKTNKKYIYSFKISSSQSLSFIFPTNQVPGHRRQKHAFNELGRPYPS